MAATSGNCDLKSLLIEAAQRSLLDVGNASAEALAHDRYGSRK